MVAASNLTLSDVKAARKKYRAVLLEEATDHKEKETKVNNKKDQNKKKGRSQEKRTGSEEKRGRQIGRTEFGTANGPNQ